VGFAGSASLSLSTSFSPTAAAPSAPSPGALQENANAGHRFGGRAAKSRAASQDGQNQAPWVQSQADCGVASTRRFRFDEAFSLRRGVFASTRRFRYWSHRTFSWPAVSRHPRPQAERPARTRTWLSIRGRAHAGGLSSLAIGPLLLLVVATRPHRHSAPMPATSRSRSEGR
jgi:hypothetical protein